jgi:hypothetical protein
VHRLHAATLGRRIGLAVVVMFVLVVLGCGSGGPPMGRVSGVVTYKDKPLDTGTVTFVATDGKSPNATGTIKSGGSYTLQTSEPGDGAVVGDYKVAITDVDSNVLNTSLPGAPAAAPKSAIPKQYQDANTSGLTAKVESGSNTKNFDLK